MNKLTAWSCLSKCFKIKVVWYRNLVGFYESLSRLVNLTICISFNLGITYCSRPLEFIPWNMVSMDVNYQVSLLNIHLIINQSCEKQISGQSTGTKFSTKGTNFEVPEPCCPETHRI